MLKNLVISGLTVLTLFTFSGTAYSQYAYAMYAQNPYVMVSPNARAYAPDYIWSIHTNGYINSDYYAELPAADDPYYKYMYYSDTYVPESDVEAARAVYISTQTVVISNGRDPSFITYRRYIRPSDIEEAETVNYFEPAAITPSVNGKTATLVAPHGYTYYQQKTEQVHPIRDFRTDYWQDKYYRDEFHNQASYNKTYGAYNYWNAWDISAAGDKSVGAPFGD